MIIVDGNPVPKGRPRVTFRGTYTPKKTVEYEALVARSYKEQGGIIFENGTKLMGEFVVVFGVPKSYSKKQKEAMYGQPHLRKPDIDNVIKSVLDALNGVAYEDDGCVCEIHAIKRWTYENEEPCLAFNFTEIVECGTGNTTFSNEAE